MTAVDTTRPENYTVLEDIIKKNVRRMYRKDFAEANSQEIYQALSLAVKDVVIDDWLKTQQAIHEQKPKIVYYMSMEFLMGRALGNILLNLSRYDNVKKALEEMNIDIN
ncbi:MAG: glycogen phosphorylase, partial [Lachnospiraceae bacterium]|nr:glycogen phosphorylase [Lachnospiraceae bacterium]